MNILSQQHIEGGGEWSLVRVCNFSFYIFINFPADLTQYNNIYMTSKERSLFCQIESYYSPLACSKVFEPRDNNSSTF